MIVLATPEGGLILDSVTDGDRRTTAEVRGVGKRYLVRLRWESLTGSVVDERAEVFQTPWECLEWLRAGDGLHPDLARSSHSLAGELSKGLLRLRFGDGHTETGNT